eukprot:767336-Hanusia_phi.AAC.6
MYQEFRVGGGPGPAVQGDLQGRWSNQAGKAGGSRCNPWDVGGGSGAGVPFLVRGADSLLGVLPCGGTKRYRRKRWGGYRVGPSMKLPVAVGGGSVRIPF